MPAACCGPLLTGELIVIDAKRVHPDAEQLKAYGLGRLPADARAAIERHVLECAVCAQALGQLPDDTLLARLRTANTPPCHTTGPARVSGSGSTAPQSLPRELLEHPRYRVIRLLGSGGMGVVYQAEHRLMHRMVALKVISKELTGDDVAVARFQREVQAAARLTHPNIVSALDAETAGDLHFLVMEYIEGISLAALVKKRGPLPCGQACEFVRQAALGLQHASEQGMVHRDVKPQNLMVTRKGQIKILDFGLARLSRPGGAQGGRRLTVIGTVVGTPDYMAPEQSSDSSCVDIRADIYSLGCTLYFLLSGQTPFPEGSALQKMTAHVQDAPKALSEIRRDLPPDVLPIVARMMAKNPADRYATPAEAAKALAPLASLKPPASLTANLPPVDAAKALAPLASLKPPASLTVNLPPVSRTARLPRPSTRGVTALIIAIATLAGIALIATLHPPGDNGRFMAGRTLDESNTSSRAVLRRLPVPTDEPPIRVVYIMARRSNSHSEYAAIRQALGARNIGLVVAAPELDPVLMHPTDPGDPVEPGLLLDQVRAADFAAIVIGGGIGVVENYVSDTPDGLTAARVVNEFLAAQKPVTAIGKGVPGMLASHGFLHGKQAVCSDDNTARIWLQKFGAVWRNEPVVVDGTILTVRDAAAAPEFSARLVAMLGENRLGPGRP